VLWFILLVHIILSWLINFQVLNLRQPIVAQIWDGLNRLLEPIYSRIRRLPARHGRDRPGAAGAADRRSMRSGSSSSTTPASLV
jgi:hypothetical protein